MKALTVLVLLLVITGLHYFTPLHHVALHDFYKRLYYIPIVLGAFWYGLKGGLACSVFSSLAYAPHAVLRWNGTGERELDELMEVILFNAVGFVAGVFAEGERLQRRRSELTLRDLESSNRLLKEQAEELAKYEEDLKRTERLAGMGEMAAALAHEIRNPLGSIKGTAQILVEDIPKNGKRWEFASILAKEVERLDRVLSQFLSFARPKDPIVSPINMRLLLESLEKLMRESLSVEGKKIVLQFCGTEELIGDESQFRQVFSNLILNASHAMKGGGDIRVETTVQKRGKTFLRVSISDSGEGIEKSDLSRVFDPFFTTKEEGTGLGLAISNRIIKKHGGWIEVESKRGKGSVFTVVLPVR